MADLTPELLAQLEEDAAGFSSTAFRWMVDADRGDGERGNALVADDGRWLTEIGPDLDAHVAEPIARLLSAAPPLVAAAKERDQLRTRQQELLATIARLSQTVPFAEEIAGWEGQRAKMIAEVGTLRAEVSEGKSEIKQLSEMLGDSQVDRAYLSEKVDKLQDEVAQLRAEVERLRKLGIEAVEIADGCADDAREYGAPPHRIAALRAEIERKP